ncbi:MAG: hypothetical protein CMI58_03275 [Parcubacteria group bacterium]|jgi:hypothetical protein|nr:hypothetical protein [Parcubacteria group bacterium]
MDQEIFIAKNKYISSKRSAELFGYTHDYLSRLAKNGVIKGKKFGRAWYLDENSLKDFIKDILLFLILFFIWPNIAVSCETCLQKSENLVIYGRNSRKMV